MKKETKETIVDNLAQLVELFQDKIVELCKVKGCQTERHAFIYYRELAWEIITLMENQ